MSEEGRFAGSWSGIPHEYGGVLAARSQPRERALMCVILVVAWSCRRRWWLSSVSRWMFAMASSGPMALDRRDTLGLLRPRPWD
jgi:hypothetical protein